MCPLKDSGVVGGAICRCSRCRVHRRSRGLLVPRRPGGCSRLSAGHRTARGSAWTAVNGSIGPISIVVTDAHIVPRYACGLL